MKLIVSAMAICLFAAAPALAQSSSGPVATAASKGKMLFDASGGSLAPVYRVESDGSVGILFDGRLVTVPGSTLSNSGGKLVTSLKKAEVASLP